jgi:DNA-directed RNA polymerase I, II, and III subunit RPABC5
MYVYIKIEKNDEIHHRKLIMIPVRCFTCGKTIAHLWETYNSHLKSGLSKADALDEVGLHRYCCRRMFLTHVEVVDKLLHFQNDVDGASDEKSGKSATE